MAKIKVLFLIIHLLFFTALSLNSYAEPVTVPDVVESVQVDAGSPVGQVIAFSPAGDDGNVVIDSCVTGVPDSGGIQAGVDACEADAKNHGNFVSCVTRYTKRLEREGVISKRDRKSIKRCAAHSGIGKGNNSKSGKKM